ncbi:MAG: DUF362 domain-containing protein [Clostridia bacterium]|nr:DUF362 domain-containing protein [Clostridia bacterium]
MEKSKVYFTDFRVRGFGDPLTKKLKDLAVKAGIGNIDMKGKFVAIKMHFGELGNLSFLRPNYARAIVDLVREMGGTPYLTDCNTLYPGSRKNAVEHLYCAWENGFTPMTVNAPILIGDGLKGTDEAALPIAGGEYCKEAYIGRAVADADVLISLTHFKGHENTGFGGTMKNIGMGCGSRRGKKEMHCSGHPTIEAEACRGCKLCQRQCANNGLTFDPETKKMSVNENCLGCGRCIGACNFDAISFRNYDAAEVLCCRIAEYTKAVTDAMPSFHLSLVMDISPNCDCHAENDAPILPDIGMFASFDPVAIDQACADACLAAEPLPNAQLSDIMAKPDFVDKHDHFDNCGAESDWKAGMAHAEKIGLGSRAYELIRM